MFCISDVEILKYVETGVAYDVTSYLKPNRADYMEGALANEDRYGIILQTDLQSGYQVFEFYPFLRMNGGAVLSEDGTQVAIHSEATAKAFSFCKEIFVVPGTCKKVENSNTDITPFATGRTARQICGSWAVSWLTENYTGTTISMILTAILFACFQKSLIEGVKFSGIKI